MSDFAINLIPLRAGATADEFTRFSAEEDQPACLAHDVVEGFDTYAVTRRMPGAPEIDFVEIMQVRSWDEWVAVRDGAADLEPVTRRFAELVDPASVGTLFGRRIPPRI